jgi:sugar/nucleoside kinase (ribokinase family)
MAVSPHPVPFGAAHNLQNDVLLFGELLVDCFADREVIGGAPFNVARHLRGLGRHAGFDPMLVSRIGKDERGARMLEKMQAADLAIDGIQQDLLRPTGEVRVKLDEASHTHRFDILPDQAWDFIHADMARLIGCCGDRNGFISARWRSAALQKRRCARCCRPPMRGLFSTQSA